MEASAHAGAFAASTAAVRRCVAAHATLRMTAAGRVERVVGGGRKTRATLSPRLGDMRNSSCLGSRGGAVAKVPIVRARGLQDGGPVATAPRERTMRAELASLPAVPGSPFLPCELARRLSPSTLTRVHGFRATAPLPCPIPRARARVGRLALRSSPQTRHARAGGHPRHRAERVRRLAWVPACAGMTFVERCGAVSWRHAAGGGDGTGGHGRSI
jgi:hypothetical protein